MVIVNNTYAESADGRYIHRLGTEIYGRRITLLPGDTADSFEEVDAPPRYTREQYEHTVAALVRERYTADEEFALQRKVLNSMLSPMTLSADTAEKTMAEYADYNNYVEQCKLRAKDPGLYDGGKGGYV